MNAANKLQKIHTFRINIPITVGLSSFVNRPVNPIIKGMDAIFLVRLEYQYIRERAIRKQTDPTIDKGITTKEVERGWLDGGGGGEYDWEGGEK